MIESFAGSRKYRHNANAEHANDSAIVVPRPSFCSMLPPTHEKIEMATEKTNRRRPISAMVKWLSVARMIGIISNVLYIMPLFSKIDKRVQAIEQRPSQVLGYVISAIVSAAVALLFTLL